MNTTLYQIRADHLALLSEVEQLDGELTPEIEAALSLTNEQFEQKAVSYGYVIKTFDERLNQIDAEITRLTELRKKAVKQVDLFEQRLSAAMQEFGYEKITTPTLTLSFRKSESVEITDMLSLPEYLITKKVTESPKKDAIKHLLRDGVDVPGAQIVVKNNLQIR